MKDYNYCYAEFSSETHAMKAQAVLSRYAVPSRIIKLDLGRRFGCTFGLSFDSAQRRNVQKIFENEKIQVKSWGVES